MASTLVPFGQAPDGRMVSAREVPRGLACNCVCAACGGRLVAKQGDVRAHHFSHHDAAECRNGFETAVHRMAKQILLEQRGLWVPGLVLRETRTDDAGRIHHDSEDVAERRRLEFDDIAIETTLDGCRPDVIGYCGGKTYCMEILVTHKSGHDKRTGLRNRGVFALEITVPPVEWAEDMAEIVYRAVIDEVHNKHWLSFPPAAAAKIRLGERLDAAVRQANETLKVAQQPPTLVLRHSSSPKPVRKPRVFDQQTPVFDYHTLFCEHCRHIWTVPNEDMPPCDASLPCPHCGARVSCRGVLDTIRQRYGGSAR